MTPVPQVLTLVLALVGAMLGNPGAVAAKGDYSPHYDVKQLSQHESFEQAQARTLDTFRRLRRVFGRHRVQIGRLDVANHSEPEGPHSTLPIFYCRILSHNAAREKATGKTGSAAEREKVVVDVTGTHGCEGGVGLKLVGAELEALADAAEHAQKVSGTTAGLAELPDDGGRLIFTALNPEGMRHNSRTSRWADANRNWWSKDSPPVPPNPDYARLSHILNPEGPAEYRDWKDRAFLEPLLTALAKEARRQLSLGGAIQSLKVAIMEGQSSEHREGMSWVGDPSQRDPRNDAITEVLRMRLGHAGAVLVRDWHTGYGRWGHLSVVAPESDNGPESDNRIGDLMREVGRGLDIGWASKDGGFYPMKGSFLAHVAGLFPDKVVLPWIYEAGTVEGPRLSEVTERRLRKAKLGGILDVAYSTARDIQSLQWMIQRHQGARHGFATAADEALIMGHFIEMFGPTSVAWWEHIVKDVHRVHPGMLERFFAL